MALELLYLRWERHMPHPGVFKMSEFLDINSFIEKTVQETLGEEPKIAPAPAPEDVQLETVEIGEIIELQADHGENPDWNRPVHRGSFAANLLSGSQFFADQILKRKLN